MAESTLWWLLSAAAVALELATGTFYLLMVAIGLCAGALSAHMGFSVATQISVAAVLSSACVVLWHLRKMRDHREAPAQANANVNLDIGETVQITAWNADATADVQYRGARWTAVRRTNSPTTATGSYRVVEVVGNRLVVDKI